jgi:ABC-type enterobactin transport system permease subunit
MRANPGIVLTGIAAAIAVPIAFVASDDDAS